MKNKKGAELSVNVIIIAVIALLVLVVLFAIFTGRMGIFNVGISDCLGKGGKCKDTCDSTSESYMPALTCKAAAGSTPPKCCMSMSD
jgi:hypothetical protein